MYIFPNERNYSRAAMTNCTDYKANNVMTSTREVIDDLTENGIKMINVECSISLSFITVSKEKDGMVGSLLLEKKDY